ncbi:site-specific tyrosine recombinase XerD [Streptococcus suis]|uniref:site-specific tyrosine recombinase XerD n=1 Tax=Streptococcus TaxID=1301 RepID=UPI00143269D8|nr:site-specific tyrosine recombinase XerD [Streptococcus suis]
MKDWIAAFIRSKSISSNSQKSYTYDLQQFMEVTQGQVNQQTILTYQQTLLTLKPAAQKRKLSAVNQFLYFLYEEGQLERFYKLKALTSLASIKQRPQVEDLSPLWMETAFLDGQTIALLIGFLGLTPSEIAELTVDDLNLDFQVLTVQKGQTKRVLDIPKEILPYLENRLTGVYLFDKKGQPYSRQWFFNRLTEFVSSIGRSDWTAQKLREQYILGQIKQGKSLDQLVKQLGLKSSMSLEKYK